MKTLFFAIATLFAAAVSAGTIDPKTPDQKHVDYGAKFECVARISCRENKSGKTAYASCVAVSPRWVVTAGHVVADSSDWKVILLNGKTVKIEELIIHEEFKEASLGFNDIAVGKCEEDLGLSFYPALYAGDDETGKVVSICGYGVTGTFSTGANLSDGKRRAGSNTIDHCERGVLVCSVGSGIKTELEFLIAPGDSGGGLFIGNQLAGINSFLMVEGRSPASKYGEESGHTRVSLHREWIHERIGK